MANVRAGAQLAGVHPRVVWCWLDAVRGEGRLQRRARSRFELSDQAWEVLAQAGGNVVVLYRHLKDVASGGDAGPVPAGGRRARCRLGETLHRVVRRELDAGRALPDPRVTRLARAEQQNPTGSR
ncbi:hypothetical protein GCM10009863_67650 [Streptomyces axinellae]|uniref:Transposase n=1 Tax=Streptomyces axinellae TaxID=552788 RepID=A0ABN3R168_9ACTN